jgi:cobalt/nickel transport system permease protein
MGIVAVWVGWAVFVLVRAVLPTRPWSVVAAAGAGALVSVPAAAFAFAGLFAVGGATPIAFSTLAWVMVGIHVLIGLGEAGITALAVLSIVLARPDLVHGARPLLRRRALVIREEQPA